MESKNFFERRHKEQKDGHLPQRRHEQLSRLPLSMSGPSRGKARATSSVHQSAMQRLRILAEDNDAGILPHKEEGNNAIAEDSSTDHSSIGCRSIFVITVCSLAVWLVTNEKYMPSQCRMLLPDRLLDQA